MYVTLIATLALTAANAVKISQTDYDCLTYTATDVEVSFGGPESATVTWTAPSSEESAIVGYSVYMLDQEFPCDASPCTIDISDLVSPGDKVSAYVLPVWKEDFIVPFPIFASAEVSVCEGNASQKLADALKAKDEAAAVAALACPVDQTVAPLYKGFQ